MIVNYRKYKQLQGLPFTLYLDTFRHGSYVLKWGSVISFLNFFFFTFNFIS